jgi:hypothetical protein
MTIVRNFDQRCHDLACIFLADDPPLNTPARQDDLALAIQQAIEDWFSMNPPVGEP